MSTSPSPLTTSGPGRLGSGVPHYEEFLKYKRLLNVFAGIDVENVTIHPALFPFQSAIVEWAIKKGRCAVFADTGLGKTFIQLEWARIISSRCILVAPLSVARQTIKEASKLGLVVNYCRASTDVKDGLNITNYEMVEHLDPALFDAIVLDESSILKSIDGKTNWCRLCERPETCRVRRAHGR